MIDARLLHCCRVAIEALPELGLNKKSAKRFEVEIKSVVDMPSKAWHSHLPLIGCLLSTIPKIPVTWLLPARVKPGLWSKRAIQLRTDNSLDPDSNALSTTVNHSVWPPFMRTPFCVARPALLSAQRNSACSRVRVTVLREFTQRLPFPPSKPMTGTRLGL